MALAGWLSSPTAMTSFLFRREILLRGISQCARCPGRDQMEGKGLEVRHFGSRSDPAEAAALVISCRIWGGGTTARVHQKQNELVGKNNTWECRFQLGPNSSPHAPSSISAIPDTLHCKAPAVPLTGAPSATMGESQRHCVPELQT